jgi:hypothetical protein
MPLSPEVDIFQGKVGRDQHFVPWGQPQHGAVIANTDFHGTLMALAGLANSGDERLFWQGHGDHYIDSDSDRGMATKWRAGGMFFVCQGVPGQASKRASTPDGRQVTVLKANSDLQPW